MNVLFRGQSVRSFIAGWLHMFLITAEFLRRLCNLCCNKMPYFNRADGDAAGSANRAIPSDLLVTTAGRINVSGSD